MKRRARIFVLLVVAAVVMQPVIAAFAVCGATGARHECCPAHLSCSGIHEESQQAAAVTASRYEGGWVAQLAFFALMPIAEKTVAMPAFVRSASTPLARHALFRVFRI